MEMFERPVEGKENMFDVTKDRAYCAPYSRGPTTPG
jgi:hypothetical protein